MANAFGGWAGVVVAAHGQANMAFVNQAGVGNVDADPTACGNVQAHIDPGVAGQVGLVGSVKVAADVPGGSPGCGKWQSSRGLDPGTHRCLLETPAMPLW